MKAKAPLPWIALAFVTAAAAGWFAGGRDAAPPAASPSTPLAKTSGRESPAASRRRLPDGPRAQMERIRRAGSMEERQRATIHLARTLPISELATWYDRGWFDLDGGMEGSLFERISRERWLAEDPAGLIGYCVSRDAAGTRDLAAAWALREPESALAFLHEVKDQEQFRILINAMGKAIAKTDPARVLREITSLYSGPGASSRTSDLSEVLGTLAAAAPDLLERELAGWPQPLKRMAFTDHTEAALQRDLPGTLAKLTTREDGLKIFLDAIRNQSELVERLIKQRDTLPHEWFVAVAGSRPYHAVKENPGHWLQEDLAAAGFTEQQIREVRRAAIEQLARDPSRLTGLLGQIPWQERERQTAVAYAIKYLREKDQAQAEAWAAGLTDPQDLEAAASSMDWQQKATVSKARDQTPATWVEKWSENATALDYYGAEPMFKWSQQDAAAAIQAFQKLPDERKQLLAPKLAKGFGKDFPAPLQAQGLSFVLAAAGATDQQALQQLQRSASDLATRWAATDPQAGGKWVSSLPAGEPRIAAAKNLAAVWAQREPSAARRWAATLPAGERTVVEGFLQEQR